nr:MAG TPA: hypothetical protein [Bacteriophage sp.]DAX07365.1 MAG TPA: hypothetical protein [Bacteriophage sp.]
MYFKGAGCALLACSGLTGSIPAASIKHILYVFLCVP